MSSLRQQFDTEALEALSNEMSDSPQVGPVKVLAYEPDLNPVQQKAYDSKAKYSLLHAERGSGKCRSVSDICYLGDKIIRLGCLNPGILFGEAHLKVAVWSFDGNRPVVVKTNAFYKEIRTDAIRLDLEHGGELIGSPNHPVWCCVWKFGEQEQFRYVNLAQMHELKNNGYRIWTPMMPHPGITTQDYQEVSGIKITENLGYLMGALCGDGSINECSKREVRFSNIDPECIRRVHLGLSELGATMVNSSKRPCEHRIRTQKKLKLLVVAARMSCLSYHKFIPDFIISSPRDVIVAFMRGLFDTDGTVDKAGTVAYCTTSQRLGVDVQNVLMALGIFAVRRPKKSASGRPTWTISIMGRQAWKFGQVVGFEISRKQARIVQRSKYSHNRYTYPEPIRWVMKGVCSGNRAHIRPRKRQKFRQKFGKRVGVVWEMSTMLPWGRFYKRTVDYSEAVKIEDQVNIRLEKYYRKHYRSDDWHNKHRSTNTWKYIPGRERLDRFMALYSCHHEFWNYLISDHWVEVVGLDYTHADLADLSVPGTRAFLCSGTINHNTEVALHKMVRHCYEEQNALALVIIGVKRQAEEGGAWHKLVNNILPKWEHGMGLDHDRTPFYTDPKSNTAKDTFVWVRNKSGLLSSRILLLSMPVEGFVADRVKGMEPSFILVDEAQTLGSDVYFKSIIQQLGRRPGIKGVQQIVYCCNPEGPSHWLYKRFFIDPIDKITGRWNPEYAQIHVPIQENIHNLPKGYWENVVEAVRDDPIEEARMVRGEWIDRPSGVGIFADVFNEARHVRGNAVKNQGLLPWKGYPIILGYDPGAAHTSIHFLQVIPTVEKIIWLVFDELNYVGAYKPYCDLVPEIVARMVYWETRVPHRFIFQHISDNSAFNQYRAKDGSFDAWDIEKISVEYVEQHKLDPRYIIRLQECPKGAHSIEARVRLVRDALYRDEILISATCLKTKEMFLRLEEDEKAKLKPVAKSIFGHPFDSLSYPIFFYNVGRGRFMINEKAITPELYTVGR